MSRFNVGDKAVVNETNAMCSTYKAGDVVEIKSMTEFYQNGELYDVLYAVKKPGDVCPQDLYGRHLSHVEVKQPPPFKPQSILSQGEELALLYSVREQVVELSKEVTRLKTLLDGRELATIAKRPKRDLTAIDESGRPAALPVSSKGRG